MKIRTQYNTRFDSKDILILRTEKELHNRFSLVAITTDNLSIILGTYKTEKKAVLMFKDFFEALQKNKYSYNFKSKEQIK